MLKVFGEHDEKTVKQMWTCLNVGSVHRGVLCADGHLGYAQPVGGVVAYEKHISLSGVGFDIACGNMAAKLDMTYSDLEARIPTIAKDINKRISFGVGRTYGQSDINKQSRLADALFSDDEAWKKADVEDLRRMAEGQLGTVGSGNHYVDLFRDAADDHVWIGVHFGSRGLGHKTATKYLKLAGGVDGMEVPPCVVDAESELGERYVAAMELAGRYAYAGREWVVETIRKMLAAKVIDSVHNHHNYAWREKHGDREYWVVRKGATPAFPGQRGFVGGSMGDDAVIIRGVDSEASRESLYSTVHGAGRICGRVEAKGKMKNGEWVRPPRFTREQMDEWLREKNVYLIGGDVDESPMAYRRLNEVLAHHDGTIEVESTLKPFLVVMAGNDVRDPYKD
jgi:tRNA-splicing ligase RtcB